MLRRGDNVTGPHEVESRSKKTVSHDGSRFSEGGYIANFGNELFPAVLTSLADLCVLVSKSARVSMIHVKPEAVGFDAAKALAGHDFASVLDEESGEKLRERLSKMLQDAEGKSRVAHRWVEVSHDFGDGIKLPMRYAIHWIPDREEFLLLGMDQRPVLEMQQMLLNAQIALESDYEAQREITTRYRFLMDFTTDAVVLVSAVNGQIVDINHNAATLLGSTRAELIKRSFADQFVGRHRTDILAAISASSSLDTTLSTEMETRANARKLLLTPKLFRAAGEQLSMVRIGEVAQGSAADGRLMANLRDLFHRGADAIVFTDKEGVILAASETFLNLTDAPSLPAVRGRSMADFLSRGIVDLKVLLENARRAGQLRMYSTKLKTDFDANVTVEISATWLDDRSEPVLALIIRNASNAAAMRADTATPEANMRGVMELVGSSTLKDIVSDTTNVIEKICIETAIELTRNNRVAAADMLGLSRQSLYVKLRKYGLLSRDEA